MASFKTALVSAFAAAALAATTVHAAVTLVSGDLSGVINPNDVDAVDLSQAGPPETLLSGEQDFTSANDVSIAFSSPNNQFLTYQQGVNWNGNFADGDSLFALPAEIHPLPLIAPTFQPWSSGSTSALTRHLPSP